MTQDNYQLSNQPQFNEDSFTQCLKQAYQDRIQYSRLSHHAIVALDPIETNELSSEYVAEYKNTSNQLPTHIFKLTNHAYLHMRRTGIDQSILLK
jgi:chitin synthase